MDNDELSQLSLVVNHDKSIKPVRNVEATVPREQEYGVRNPRKLPDTKMPSKEEVEQRYLTHLPSATGASIASRARGRWRRTSNRNSGRMG